MKRETIFHKGIKPHHRSQDRVVNVYRSPKNAHGIQYGYARPLTMGVWSRAAIYRIRIIWK